MAHSFEKTQNGPLTDTAELYCPSSEIYERRRLSCAAVFHFMASLAGGVTLLSLFIYFNNPSCLLVPGFSRHELQDGEQLPAYFVQ